MPFTIVSWNVKQLPGDPVCADLFHHRLFAKVRKRR
jgi:hypothetical protein